VTSVASRGRACVYGPVTTSVCSTTPVSGRTSCSHCDGVPWARPERPLIRQIDVGARRDGLDTGKPVIVLDTRAGEVLMARGVDARSLAGGMRASESALVDRVTTNRPPTPPNVVRSVDINEAGDVPITAPTEPEAGANRCALRP